MNGRCAIGTGIDWSVEIRPPAGSTMGPAELEDSYLGAADTNTVLDAGDRSEPVLLVGRGRERRMGYEFLGADWPGMTIEQAAANMKKAGFDIRGISNDRRYIIGVEKF